MIRTEGNAFVVLCLFAAITGGCVWVNLGKSGDTILINFHCLRSQKKSGKKSGDTILINFHCLEKNLWTQY